MSQVTRRTIETPGEVRDYAAGLVRELGIRCAAERVGLSRHALSAVALGEPVTRGTVAIVREAMRGGATTAQGAHP